MFYSSCKPDNRVANIFGDVESVFNHLFDRPKSNDSLHPVSDIVERKDAFTVTLELPGVKPEDVKVEFEDGILTIAGEKSIDRSEEDANYHRSERVAGTFERKLEFKTPVEVDGIEASFEYGLLNVRVPKSEKALARKIEVKTN